ncbi:MAG: DUF1015 domain-containing protein [Clostridiales bacterium]|nr:DUF1015 domain-containing protein [Clostridiales bacterium]
MDTIIRAPRVLLPDAKCSMEKWAVVACDQFTSQKEYWQETETITAGEPSTLNIIYPEAWLSQGDARIAKINETMKEYLSGVLTREVNGYILVERETTDGKRLGLMAEIDLEAYDFMPGAKPRIRATEGTILERVPPRVKIREGAPVELPHVMLLADDPDKTLIEPLYEKRDSFELLYDFDLMQGGGHIRGWKVDSETVEETALKLETEGMLFAVGDGNHSLAAARQCYLNNPNPLARYALVEIVNLYDPALVFEPIHRAIFGADGEKFLNDFANAFPKGDKVTLIVGDKEESFDAVLADIQPFVDQWIRENGAEVDYIHGADVVRKLAAEGAVGMLLQVLNKKELFPQVRAYGALPRKAFSMGHANDKRYYLECRRIKP